MRWDAQGTGLLEEYDRERRWVKTWIVVATKAPVLLFDRSGEDRYGDPGSPLMRAHGRWRCGADPQRRLDLPRWCRLVTAGRSSLP